VTKWRDPVRSLCHLATLSACQLWGWIDRRLEVWRIRFVAVAILAVTLILTAVSFISANRSRTIFGPPLGADFAGFYTAGIILNHYPADRLYDRRLHDQLYHELLPGKSPDEELPFVHPPFVALPFQLLALIPYEWSFALWLLICAGLYLAGLALLGKTLAVLPDRHWSVAVILAISFEPFLMECWLGGQLSAVAFFCMALALACEHQGHPLAAGMAVGLCLYKPTLLVLAVPMLVVARRWQALLGFLASACVLALVSLAAVGWEGCNEFVKSLFDFSESATGNAMVLKTWKYVDLNSFLRLLLGHSPANWIVLLCLVAVPLAWLAMAWWRWDRLTTSGRQLVWAATLTGTVVFNLYVGIYDSILCVLGMFLTADVLARGRSHDESLFTPRFRLLLFLLYLTPWLSQPLAKLVHVQVFTLVLVAAAIYPLLLLRQTK
jgi:Glycosyltransferase family 87